jgi:hypothetical protein
MFKLENFQIKNVQILKVSEKDSKPQKINLKTSKIRPAEKKAEKPENQRKSRTGSIQNLPKTGNRWHILNDRLAKSLRRGKKKKVKWARPANEHKTKHELKGCAHVNTKSSQRAMTRVLCLSFLTYGIVPGSSSRNQPCHVPSTERYDRKLYTHGVPDSFAALILVPRSCSSTWLFPKHGYYG